MHYGPYHTMLQTLQYTLSTMHYTTLQYNPLLLYTLYTMHPPTNTGKHNNVQQKQYQHHPSTIHNFPSNEQGSLLPRTMRHSKATQSSQHDRKQGLSYQIIRQANQGATQKWLNPHDMWQETGLILSNYQVGKSDPTLQQDRKRETYQMIRLANQGESVQRLLNYVNVSSGFPSFQHRDSSVQDCATFT